MGATEQEGMKTIRPLLINLAVLATTILIFLIAAETAIRLTTLETDNEPVILTYSDNPLLLYENAVNASAVVDGVTFSTNSHGMRYGEIALKKEPKIRRIALLGDSVAFGHGLPYNESFGAILEQSLNNGKKEKYEVLNFAVEGYGTLEQVETLRSKALDFKPDFVIITYVLNDPEISTSLQSYFSQHPRDQERICKIHAINLPIPCPARDFVDSLRLPDFIYGKIIAVQSKVEGDYFTLAHQDESLWGSVTSSYSILANLTQERDIPVVVVIFPLFVPDQDYRWEWIHEMVELEAREQGFQVLDLLDPLQKAGIENVAIHRKDPLHPNANGNKIAAAEIEIFLREEKLIPS